VKLGLTKLSNQSFGAEKNDSQVFLNRSTTFQFDSYMFLFVSPYRSECSLLSIYSYFCIKIWAQPAEKKSNPHPHE